MFEERPETGITFHYTNINLSLGVAVFFISHFHCPLSLVMFVLKLFDLTYSSDK